MLYEIVRPTARLARSVDFFWRVEAEDYPVRREVLLPGSGPTLLVNLGDPFSLLRPGQEEEVFRRSWLSGERTEPFVLEAHGRQELLGVQFRSGGAAEFFRSKFSELVNGVANLDDLWPRAKASRVEELVHEATTTRSMADVLASELAPNGPSGDAARAVRGAVHLLGQTDDTLTVRKLAARMGLSQRSLLRSFNRRVGPGPKMLQRVLRFERVLHLEDSEPNMGWDDIAADSGYFDQAHLNNEFREFCRVTPTEYRRSKGLVAGYILDDDPEGLDGAALDRMREEIASTRSEHGITSGG